MQRAKDLDFIHQSWHHKKLEEQQPASPSWFFTGLHFYQY